METVRNIDIPLVSSLLTLTGFNTFSQYFIVEFLGEGAGIASCIYQLVNPYISNYRITVYINYSIQNVGFEETSTNFIGIHSKNIGRIVNIEKNVQFDIYAIISNLFRDCQLITFVTLNRFCPLSKKTINPSVRNRQYQDEWNTNKNGYKFLYCISSFEGTSYK